MEYQNLLYQKEEGLAKITINRPQALNAISPELLLELKAAVEEASMDSEVAVIVLTGAGRAFSAGVDLKSLGSRKLEAGSVGAFLNVPARDLIETIQKVPKPVIAAVNGYCFTGALEIVLGCDLVVAAEEAKIGDTHARWGLRPTWGMSARLPYAAGMLKAKELSFTAEAISGEEAARIGLVNAVVPANRLEEAVRDLAKKIMANSRDSIAAYKYLYNRQIADQVGANLALEWGTEFPIVDTEERLKSFRK